jgi:hypothetical protein
MSSSSSLDVNSAPSEDTYTNPNECSSRRSVQLWCIFTTDAVMQDVNETVTNLPAALPTAFGVATIVDRRQRTTIILCRG